MNTFFFIFNKEDCFGEKQIENVYKLIEVYNNFDIVSIDNYTKQVLEAWDALNLALNDYFDNSDHKAQVDFRIVVKGNIERKLYAAQLINEIQMKNIYKLGCISKKITKTENTLDDIKYFYRQFLSVYTGTLVWFLELPYLHKMFEDEKYKEFFKKINSYQIEGITTKISDIQHAHENTLCKLEKELTTSKNNEQLEKEYSNITNEIATELLENTSSQQNLNYLATEEATKTFFGDAWKKIDRNSKTWLVQAQYLFELFSKEKIVTDYAVVCLSACKALENELVIRFYNKYLDYLQSIHPIKSENDYDYYPPVFIKIKNGTKKLIEPEDFTLGKIPVLCDSKHDWNDPDYLNKKITIQYAKEKLLIDNTKSDDEIAKIIKEDIGSNVDKITKKWRNKAAHPNKIDRNNANNCLDYIIKVKQFLKSILDLFNY